jgi:molecular chaperone DnaJ
MTPSNKDYYSILQIDHTATPETIKSAYRKLALKLHPDINDSAQAQEDFRKVQEAYQILSDEKKRRQYDTLQALSLGVPFAKLREKFADPQVLRSVMQKVGAGLAAAAGLIKKTKGRRGKDIRILLDLSFEKSYRGATIQPKYSRSIECANCEGTGFSQVEPCATCNSTGHLASKNIPGIKKRCPRCGGKGWTGISACTDCDSLGRIEKSEAPSVKVPPGIRSGQRLRLKNMGHHGTNGGDPGALIVKINIPLPPGTRTDGDDLLVEISISFRKAFSGGTVTAQLPMGPFQVAVPSISWDGRVLRVIGLGLFGGDQNATGDAYFTVRIKMPENKDEKALYLRYTKILRESDSKLDETLKSDLEGYFSKK